MALYCLIFTIDQIFRLHSVLAHTRRSIADSALGSAPGSFERLEQGLKNGSGAGTLGSWIWRPALAKTSDGGIFSRCGSAQRRGAIWRKVRPHAPLHGDSRFLNLFFNFSAQGHVMKKIAVLLIAVASLLTGCVVYDRPYRDGGGQRQNLSLIHISEPTRPY